MTNEPLSLHTYLRTVKNSICVEWDGFKAPMYSTDAPIVHFVGETHSVAAPFITLAKTIMNNDLLLHIRAHVSNYPADCKRYRFHMIELPADISKEEIFDMPEKEQSHYLWNLIYTGKYTEIK